MLIRFLGADRTVTGSSHLLEINGLRILLDCGFYQGPRDEARRLNSLVPDSAPSLDAVILSHGHLDHCGKLPVLVNAGYAGPIYCTAATADVTRVILNDAAKIQEEDADYLNRRDRGPDQPPIQPLYRVADVAPVLKLFKSVECMKPVDLGRGVSFTFFDAGHILGSCFVWVQWTEQNAPAPGGKPHSLLFTADIGRYDTPIIRDPTPPPGPAELIITESTYGGRSHGPISAVEPQLLAAFQQCINTRSRVLLPAFAMGRSQTLLWYVQKLIVEKRIPPIRVYIDSPMAVELTRLYTKYTQSYDEQTKQLIGTNDLFGLSRVTLASSSDDSRKINDDRGPCVIIASSPTCEFGRILHHLKQSIENPNDQVIFCGFIPPNTLGRRLQDGQKRVKIFDRWYDVKCQVKTIHGLSAHADGDELMRFLAPALSKESLAYIVHGEVDQAETFANRLMKAGVAIASVPAMTTAVEHFAAIPEPTTAPPPRATDND
jgi:metallo-beta-lactamase family protein